MAVDIFLNPNTNDIDFVNNTMRLTQNIQESSRQQVLIDLSTFKGEWFFDIQAGIAYLKNDNNQEQLLGTSDKSLFDVAIKGSITSRENIVEILSYSSVFDRQARTLTVSFEATTNTGEVVSVEALPIIV
jgi:hypothetical protein